MECFAKTFSELSAGEIYEILKARMKVFLLEQNIVCLDIDDVDYDSLHVFSLDGEKVTSYLRAFKVEDYVKIGRVLTLCHGKGDGRRLYEFAEGKIKEHFGKSRLVLHSQKHAEGFYHKLGFSTVSDEYLEEGVVHVTMEKNV